MSEQLIVTILQSLPIGLLLLIILGGIRGSIAILAKGQVGVVERLGRAQRVVESGFHFIIPFIDQVRFREMRQQVIALPSDRYETKDGSTVEVRGSLSIEITDFYKASYAVADFRESLKLLMQGALKSEISQMERLSALGGKGHLTAALRATVKNVAEKWGIAVIDVAIEDVRQG